MQSRSPLARTHRRPGVPGLADLLALRPAAAPVALLGLLAALVTLLLPATLAPAAQPPTGGITVRALPQFTEARAGDRFAIAVQFTFAENLHIWPNQPVVPKELEGLEAIPTLVQPGKPTLPTTVRIGLNAGQWPAPESLLVNFTGSPVSLLSYKKPTTVFFPVAIDAAHPPGPLTIPLTVSYQACNDTTCFPPESQDLTVTLQVVPATAPAKPGDTALFASLDPSILGRLDAPAPEPTPEPAPKPAPGSASQASGARIDFLGYVFTVDSGWLILLIAFIAGALMNLTPCVLPVIPLKVASLQQHAKDPGKLVFFGLIYCVGIVSVFAVIAVLAFSLKLQFGQWFSYWYVTVPLALIVGGMGLGMLGAFDINLPQGVYNFTPSYDNASGNFFLGVLTAVLSTPCTGPMFGAAFAFATTLSPFVGSGLILSMGLGMAAPYLLLILFPGMLKNLPRGGPGGELLKQVLGLFMLAVAFFILRSVFDHTWVVWMLAASAACACIWWLVGAMTMLQSQRAKGLNALAAALSLGVTFLITQTLLPASTTSAGAASATRWQTVKNPADDQLRAQIRDAVKQGRSVVVDFTAAWCSNCLVIEKTILNSTAGLEMFSRLNPLQIKVDLTTATPAEGWGVVREISGGGGIPLIAVYGPGIDKPIYFQSFFPVSDLEAAITTAAGKGKAQANNTPR